MLSEWWTNVYLLEYGVYCCGSNYPTKMGAIKAAASVDDRLLYRIHVVLK